MCISHHTSQQEAVVSCLEKERETEQKYSLQELPQGESENVDLSDGVLQYCKGERKAIMQECHSRAR